jgi:hypothetical protein
MGTLKLQRLTDEEIIQQYRDGASQGLLSLKARISCAKIRDILVRNRIHIRSQPEALRLELRTRPRRRA